MLTLAEHKRRESEKLEQIRYKRAITTHEAAKVLFVTPTTVIQWIKDDDKELDVFYTAGGHRRIMTSSVYRLLAKTKTGAFAKSKQEQCNKENEHAT